MLKDNSILEETVYNGNSIKIKFNYRNNIRLRRGVKDKKNVVEIVMPWNRSYILGAYRDKKEAEKEFQKYDKNLREGYSIRIKGRTAMLLK